MARTKTSKSKKTDTRKKDAKRSSPNERLTNAELHQQLAETLQRESAAATENALLVRELTQILEQQTATSEILRVIASAPTDLQLVLDFIVETAARACAVDDVLLRIVENKSMIPRAHFGPLQTGRVEISINDEPQFRWMREHGTLHIPDLRAQTDFPRLGSGSGFLTFLGAPLRGRGKFIGALLARRIQAHPFTPVQIKLLETFADQAVIALENVRLFQEMKESIEQQTATSDVLRAIAGSPTELQPVLDAVTESAVKLSGAKRGHIRQYDGEFLRLVASYGESAEQLAVFQAPVRPRPESRSGRAFLTRKPIHDLDAQVERHRMAAQTGARTALAVPLLREDTPIGVFTIWRDVVEPFSDRQIELVKTFADQAVVAIENVRLFNELKESLEQQTATSEILGVIASSPTDVQPVLDVVAENAARLCDANDARIMRIEGNVLRPAAHYGPFPDPPHGDGTPISRGWPSGRAVVDRQTIHVHDFEAEIETEFPESKARQSVTGVRSILVTPLFREGIPIGVIVIRRKEARPFTDKQIALLKTFADQAVIAIENVRLFNEIQERTQDLARSVGELKALGEVGRAVSSTLELETVLTRIVSHAVQLSGTDGGAIYEYDETSEEFLLRATDQMEEELINALRANPPRLGDGVVGRAAVSRDPIEVPDILEERAYPPRMRQMLARHGFRASLAVPLLREEQIIGGLVVRRKSTGSFRPEVVELLKTFATQSVLAIQNARLFREIENKNREVEAANRHKSEFLANMSHELRTPLTAIIGFSEVLSEKIFGELNDKQDDYIGDIVFSGRHLLSLINDILDLSKVEAGGMQLDLSRFDLPTAIDNALILITERATRHGIKVEHRIDDRLGEVVGDERKFKQILLNLLSNAVKFTPQGGLISVRANLTKEAVEVSVIDTGIGIAPEDQDAIFEEFRQVGTDPSKKREGTGLGLTLTQKFVELHG